MVTERPILFSGPMVRALLAGAKTQTRRVVRPQPPSVEAVHGKAGDGFSMLAPRSEGGHWRVAGPVWAVRELMGGEPQWRCPYGAPGDRLWVRETWAPHPEVARRIFFAADKASWLRVTGDSGPMWDFRERIGLECPPPAKYKPSIHMPRWASRITLEVTEVRVQRVQDISEEDAKAEGAKFHDGGGVGHSGWRHDESHGYVWADARSSFRVLWDVINGKRPGCAWTDSPWVWAISFTRVATEASQ